ncbi:MAG: isoaspartyl peptidase/L-asparaginase [Chitinophagales bacterium]|nr:isoaspartyl peptidase/L-asparaginase [Chitinophagales bacterium]MDW8427720.1 isoaspartyl peptidase/L-asparaginase [Chitinophagales bacterium]
MPFALAVHGGAGVLPRSEMTDELRRQYEQGLLLALQQGFSALTQGADAVSAVVLAVSILEDYPLFNAGRGSVFNHQGQHEMDASVMDGRTLAAGAVCAVSRIRNPVQLAHLVLQRSQHVMLCGAGAEQFAVEQGMKLVTPDYFFTERRYEQFLQARRRQAMQLDDGATIPLGTVGAVACDPHGNVAAATSTGGLNNKRYGRVGDSPIIGAGTYADNRTCAVSCTGHGEFFIRHVAAFDVHCLMAYKGMSVNAAAHCVIMEKLKPAGGEGGLIAVDPNGTIAMIFNGQGMYRAAQVAGGDPLVAIY